MQQNSITLSRKIEKFVFHFLHFSSRLPILPSNWSLYIVMGKQSCSKRSQNGHWKQITWLLEVNYLSSICIEIIPSLVDSNKWLITVTSFTPYFNKISNDAKLTRPTLNQSQKDTFKKDQSDPSSPQNYVLCQIMTSTNSPIQKL